MSRARSSRRCLLAGGVGACLLAALGLALAACDNADSAQVPTVTPAPSATPSPSPTPFPVLPEGSKDPSLLTPLDSRIRFTVGTLKAEAAKLAGPTSLAFGPDGRLYVAQQTGRVVALTLYGDTVIDVQQIAPANALQDVLGIAFNPADPPDPVTLYVAHTRLFAGVDGPPYPGKIAKLVAPDFTPVDIITGLPVAAGEHATNGIAFDAQGRLYIAQGGSTNSGIPSERHPRPESPLSSAVLAADISAPGFDGNVRYDPPNATGTTIDQVAGDVRTFATGFRNPYDIVAHSNGRVYITDNGPNPGDGPRSLSCTEQGDGPWGPDELNLVREGAYYGHPNRNRGREDPGQCAYAAPWDVGLATPPIALLSYSVSADGMTEYTADTFGGLMQGDLIYVEWIDGRVWSVHLSDDGASVTAISQLVPRVFDTPLDVAMGPDGTLYVAEWNPGRISYLKPVD